MKISKKALKRIIAEEISRELASAAAGSPEGKQPLAIIQREMEETDVRTSEDYERGFSNMLKALSSLLASETVIVPKEPGEERVQIQELPWSKIFNLNQKESTPDRGEIELEYAGQIAKGILGDIMWSLKWFAERPLTGVFYKLMQKMGGSTDPEAYLLDQLISDLRAWEAKGQLKGLSEWDFDTGGPGRNIYIKPKDKQIEEGMMDPFAVYQGELNRIRKKKAAGEELTADEERTLELMQKSGGIMEETDEDK